MSIDVMDSAPRAWNNGASSLESIFWRLGGWVPVLTFFYVLVIWPFAFGDPEPSLTEQALGWLVETHEAATSVWKQIAYPTLFIVAMLGFLLTSAYRRFNWLHFGVLILAFMVFYTLSSTLWSAVPQITIMRAILFTIIVFLVALSAHLGPSSEQTIIRLFWLLALVAVLNTVALVVRKPSPIGHMGIYDHKNVFGWVAALVLYFGIYRLFTGSTVERCVAAFMVAVGALFLIVAESKTSLGLAVICPILGTVMWYGAYRMRISPAIVFAVMVITLWFIFELGYAAGLWNLFSVNQAIFGNDTLTGRTDIWAFTLGLIKEQPLFGYGYEGVFSTGSSGLVERKALGFVRGMPTAHNGYLDICVQLGLVGLAATILFLLVVLDTIGRWTVQRPAIGWLAVTSILFASMHNMLESDLMISSNPLSMFVLLLFFLALRDGQEARVRSFTHA